MKKLILIATTLLINANSITIYNNNLAYVSEDKNITLSSGLHKVKYSNLPKTVIIDSILPEIKSEDVQLYSLQFNRSQSFMDAILEQNLDKEVSFFAKDNKLISGKLKKIDPIVVESSGRYYMISSLDSLIFASYPAQDAIDSYLELKVKSNKDINSKIELNYLLTNISWYGNYTITLKDKYLNLKAWAVITNNSDKEFKNYQINLIAGNLNRSKSNYKTRVPMVKKAIMYGEAVADFAPQKIAAQSLEGYYIYKIPSIDTLSKNQTKEILLIDAKKVKYKIYAVASNRSFSNYGTQKLHFSQIVEFNNSKKNHLGITMPKGVVRVYKKGFYLGEDTISNSSKNQKIKINTGRFFDIEAKKKVVEFVAKKHYRKVKTKYILNNRGDKKRTLKISEFIPRYGSSIKYSNSCKDICLFKQKDAFIKEYKIELDAKKSYSFYTEVEIYD